VAYLVQSVVCHAAMAVCCGPRGWPFRR
jgi:hypothetical protein